MYNFNQTSLQTPPLLGVGVEFCSSTPRTPEILNSLIAMTNPFEYSYSSHTSQQSQVIPTSSLSMSPIFDLSPVMPCKVENDNSFMHQQYDTNSQSNCSSSSSLESPSTTPLHMSSAMTPSTTPSLQQTRSQLIKAGVKLLIQNKRKNSGSSSCDADCKPPPLKIRTTSLSSPTTSIGSSSRNNFIPIANNEVPSSASSLTSPKQLTSPISLRNFPLKSDCTTSGDEDDYDAKTPRAGMKNLTPEDEDRRKRRRERNKIAATKCRLKKRECINNLMRESEVLEQQNVDLKTQLKSLEEDFKYLTDMWQAHQVECKNMSLLSNNRHHQHQQQQHHLQNNHHCNNSQQALMNEIEAIKDTNNNKNLHNLDLQLPSLTPLINCNVSFDFY